MLAAEQPPPPCLFSCHPAASSLARLPLRVLRCCQLLHGPRLPPCPLQAPVVPSAERETFVFFRGGCGSPDPAVRPYFAAGKMLRWALVQALNAAGQPDIHVSLSWEGRGHYGGWEVYV